MDTTQTTPATTDATPPPDTNKPFQLCVVSETHDPVKGDDMLVRHMLAYTLRGVVTMRPDIDPSDWSVNTIVARVASPEISFVIVVADISTGPDDAFTLGPKCFAAVKTALAHNKSYLLMMPYRRFEYIAGEHVKAIGQVEDADGQRILMKAARYRFVCGEEALRVPLRNLTCSFDSIGNAVVAAMFGGSSDEGDGDE